MDPSAKPQSDTLSGVSDTMVGASFTVTSTTSLFLQPAASVPITA